MHSELLIEMRPSAHATAIDAVVTTMYRLTAAVAVVCTTVFAPNHLCAYDDGRFANSPLNEWFDHLATRNGLCCAFADGVSLQVRHIRLSSSAELLLALQLSPL